MGETTPEDLTMYSTVENYGDFNIREVCFLISKRWNQIGKSTPFGGEREHKLVFEESSSLIQIIINTKKRTITSSWRTETSGRWDKWWKNEGFNKCFCQNTGRQLCLTSKYCNRRERHFGVGFSLICVFFNLGKEKEKKRKVWT